MNNAGINNLSLNNPKTTSSSIPLNVSNTLGSLVATKKSRALTIIITMLIVMLITVLIGWKISKNKQKKNNK